MTKKLQWGKLADHGIESDGLAADMGIVLVTLQSHGEHWDIGFSVRAKGALPDIELMAGAVAEAINWLGEGHRLKRVRR